MKIYMVSLFHRATIMITNLFCPTHLFAVWHNVIPLFPMLSDSNDAFKIIWNIVQWNVILFFIKVFHVARLSYALYEIDLASLQCCDILAYLSPSPLSITALWLVLIFHPAEGRRLSWPEWLVTNRGDVPARRRSPIPVLPGPCVG